MKTKLSAIGIPGKMAALLVLSALCVTSPSLGQEIIIDNRDTNTRQTGFWWPSSGRNPYLGESLYSQERDGRFRWEPELPESGDYDVYAWWTHRPNRSNNVPYSMDLGDSFVQVFVDQSDPALGGQWNLLGRFSFNTKFGGQYIEVSGENGQASADAVRFVKIESPPVWPDVACACDEYFSRAVDKYLAYGGSMIPPGYEGGATTASCSDPTTTLDVKATYTTTVNSATGDTVSLTLEAFGFPSSGGTYGCEASVDASFLPSRTIYSQERIISVSEYNTCRESVVDFCASDPAPALP